MQDRVPLYPGRVTLTPVSGQANTFDLTRDDQPTQEGTPLNKATLLKDETAALFGLDTTAVPDDVFSLLSRFHNALGNEYVWEKTKVDLAHCELGEKTSTPVLKVSSTNYTYTLNYYRDVSADDSGNIILGASAGSVSFNPFVNVATVFDVTKGYYLQSKDTTDASKNGIIYFIPPDATFSDVIEGSYNFVVCDKAQKVTGIATSVRSFGYVNSPDPNAYPPSVDDGYTYEYRGRLGNAAQFATGSYDGTGTYGSSNPNSLTFDFEPKALFICEQTATVIKVAWSGQPGNGTATSFKVQGKTITWFTDNASNQGNSNGTIYYYFAIG